jgi:hypothetical protein
MKIKYIFACRFTFVDDARHEIADDCISFGKSNCSIDKKPCDEKKYKLVEVRRKGEKR